ncbi:uncharacterized protein V1516DRAFT_672892 [Lipomyces oligophaga]|uniref:uncharacterized protein n=1 Tax=Lipomyces oligophaga TaxID=45792 RepID=UPI0034CFE688
MGYLENLQRLQGQPWIIFLARTIQFLGAIMVIGLNASLIIGAGMQAIFAYSIFVCSLFLLILLYQLISPAVAVLQNNSAAFYIELCSFLVMFASWIAYIAVYLSSLDCTAIDFGNFIWDDCGPFNSRTRASIAGFFAICSFLSLTMRLTFRARKVAAQTFGGTPIVRPTISFNCFGRGRSRPRRVVQGPLNGGSDFTDTEAFNPSIQDSEISPYPTQSYDTRDDKRLSYEEVEMDPYESDSRTARGQTSTENPFQSPSQH